MEDEVQTGHADRLGGEVIQHISSGVEPFYLVASRNKSLKSRECRMLLMVRKMRSTLPFYGEVYGQDIHISTLWW
jgi:hypothetical protein